MEGPAGMAKREIKKPTLVVSVGSAPPGWDFQGIGVDQADGFSGARERVLLALPIIVLMRSSGYFLNLVASLQRLASVFTRPVRVAPSTGNSARSIHDDAADLRLICGTARELDHDLPRRISRRLELLLNCLVLRPSHGNDVEVRQHLRAIDQNVELSLGRLAPVNLVEVQRDRMRGSGREAANRVSAWRPALTLEDRLRWNGVGDERGVNRREATCLVPFRKVSVGDEIADVAAARVDRYRATGWFIIGGLTDNQAADERLSLVTRGQMDYDVPVLIGIGAESFHDCLVFASSGGENVKAVEDGLMIDRYVE